jgi:hypothetical protein
VLLLFAGERAARPRRACVQKAVARTYQNVHKALFFLVVSGKSLIREVPVSDRRGASPQYKDYLLAVFIGDRVGPGRPLRTSPRAWRLIVWSFPSLISWALLLSHVGVHKETHCRASEFVFVFTTSGPYQRRCSGEHVCHLARRREGCFRVSPPVREPTSRASEGVRGRFEGRVNRVQPAASFMQLRSRWRSRCWRRIWCRFFSWRLTSVPLTRSLAS